MHVDEFPITLLFINIMVLTRNQAFNIKIQTYKVVEILVEVVLILVKVSFDFLPKHNILHVKRLPVELILDVLVLDEAFDILKTHGIQMRMIIQNIRVLHDEQRYFVILFLPNQIHVVQMTLLLFLIFDPLLLKLDLDLPIFPIFQLFLVLFTELLLYFVLTFLYRTGFNNQEIAFK